MNDTNPNLETPRTLLRKYSVADRSIFTELFTDKEVNFYMGRPRCENTEEANCFLIKVWKFITACSPTGILRSGRSSSKAE